MKVICTTSNSTSQPNEYLQPVYSAFGCHVSPNHNQVPDTHHPVDLPGLCAPAGGLVGQSNSYTPTNVPIASTRQETTAPNIAAWQCNQDRLVDFPSRSQTTGEGNTVGDVLSQPGVQTKWTVHVLRTPGHDTTTQTRIQHP